MFIAAGALAFAAHYHFANRSFFLCSNRSSVSRSIRLLFLGWDNRHAGFLENYTVRFKESKEMTPRIPDQSIGIAFEV